MTLPPLSNRLKLKLLDFMRHEADIRRQIPINTPDFAAYLDELLENTVVRIMSEVEKKIH